MRGTSKQSPWRALQAPGTPPRASARSRGPTSPVRASVRSRGPTSPARAMLLGLCVAVSTSTLAPAMAWGEAKGGSRNPERAEVPAKALDEKWDPSRLRFPALGQIPEVRPDRFELANGLVVYLLRDADFPDLSGRLLVRAGSIQDPPDRVGLGQLVGTVMRTGGSRAMPGDSLDLRLESIGASIETWVEENSGGASFYCLASQAEEILGLFADLVIHPSLPADKLELARVQVRRQIASRNDEPGAIAGRLIRQLVWGRDHPRARLVEYATLDAIAAPDLAEYHRTWFVPDHAVLTITGDLDPAAMRLLLERLFGAWPRSGAPLPPDPPVPSAMDGAGGIHYAEVEAVTQSNIYLGQVGIRADHPDYPSMEIMGEILGGSWASRILNLIRTQRGLAYAAGANAGVGFSSPGTFTAMTLTRSDSTLVALSLLRGEVRRMVETPPTEEEVRRARESLLNSFVFNYRTPAQVVNRMALNEFYGYPADFLVSYQKRLREVTPQSVHEAARRHLHPGRMPVLVVGNQKDFEAPLSTLGEVHEVDLTIPAP